MPIVSGFVVPQMNPTNHLRNIICLEPVAPSVNHLDCGGKDEEAQDKKEPEEL